MFSKATPVPEGFPMTNFDEFLNEQMKDPEFKAE